MSSYISGLFSSLNFSSDSSSTPSTDSNSTLMCNVSARFGCSWGILLNYLRSQALQDKEKVHRRCYCTSVLRQDLREPRKGQAAREWERSGSHPLCHELLLRGELDYQIQCTPHDLVHFHNSTLPGSGMFSPRVPRSKRTSWPVLHESTQAVRFSSFYYVVKAYYITRRLGRNDCLYCREAPTNGSVVFCQSCYDDVLFAAPTIVKVPEDHERYMSGQLIGEYPEPTIK
jgi:hypothetical protein